MNIYFGHESFDLLGFTGINGVNGVCLFCSQDCCICVCVVCKEKFEETGWRSRESVCLDAKHATVCMSCTEFQVWSKPFNASVKCSPCNNTNTLLAHTKMAVPAIFSHGDQVDEHYYEIRRDLNTIQNPYALQFQQDLNLNAWLFSDPMRCYARYYFEAVFYGSDDSIYLRWAIKFFESFTETAINYVYFFLSKPSTVSTIFTTPKGIPYLIDIFGSMHKCLGDLTYGSARGRDYFKPIVQKTMPLLDHETKRDKKLLWINSETGIKWLATASPIVLKFLFSSEHGYTWTKSRDAQKILSSPKLSNLRSHWQFIDWLSTKAGIDWLREEIYGFSWLTKKTLFVYSNDENVEVKKRVLDVSFIKKLIQSDMHLRQLYIKAELHVPFKYEDHSSVFSR